MVNRMNFTEKDRVPEDLSEAIEFANEMIHESYFLAARIALFQEIHPDDALPYDIHDQIEGLNERVDEVAHLDITFSGVGCVPVLLPDGDVSSMYGKADIFTGNLNAFDITDPTDLADLDAEDLDEYAEEEGGGLLFVDDNEIHQLRQRMIVPPRGERLFTEFFLESTGPDELAGASVRMPSVDHYAIMDSSTLQIASMDIYQEPTCYGSDEIVDRLVDAASSMRGLLMQYKVPSSVATGTDPNTRNSS